MPGWKILMTRGLPWKHSQIWIITGLFFKMPFCRTSRAKTNLCFEPKKDSSPVTPCVTLTVTRHVNKFLKFIPVNRAGIVHIFTGSGSPHINMLWVATLNTACVRTYPVSRVWITLLLLLFLITWHTDLLSTFPHACRGRTVLLFPTQLTTCMACEAASLRGAKHFRLVR